MNSRRSIDTPSSQQPEPPERCEEKPAINWTTCPICGAAVQRRHLKRHLRRVHHARPSTIVHTPSIRSSGRLTASEAAELRRAYQESRLIADQAIADYLRRLPNQDEMGRFGVPQDKYRWGFYGSRSMEYDAWRRS